MKKFGLAILGIVAAIVVLANLGSILALAISGAIAFAGFHYYRKSDSTFLKLFWGIVLDHRFGDSRFKRACVHRHHRIARCLLCMA